MGWIHLQFTTGLTNHKISLFLFFTVLFCLSRRHTINVSGRRTRPQRSVRHWISLLFSSMTVCSGPGETAWCPLWLILTIVCNCSGDAGLQGSCGRCRREQRCVELWKLKYNRFLWTRRGIWYVLENQHIRINFNSITVWPILYQEWLHTKCILNWRSNSISVVIRVLEYK